VAFETSLKSVRLALLQNRSTAFQLLQRLIKKTKATVRSAIRTRKNHWETRKNNEGKQESRSSKQEKGAAANVP
jgi:hypothetical protein